ncbi:hypothetical protein D3C85_1397220 [compost metagenome]
MNLLVQSLAALSILPEDTADSIARIEVVPTAQIFLFSSIALLTISASFCSIMNCSESILCLVKSSTSTDLKVPSPTCKVTSAKLTPFSSSLFISSLLKCKPAVGAATAPSCLAKIVW